MSQHNNKKPLGTPETFSEKKLDTEFGQKVNVKKEKETETERAQRANRELHLQGHRLKRNEEAQYLGSMAIHIYHYPVINDLEFQTITATLGECPEIIASKAITNLKGRAMEHYGRKAPTKRSGFDG